MTQIRVRDLGKIAYDAAWEYQESLLQDNVRIKTARRNALPEGATLTEEATVNHLLFCEHPPIYTLGKSGHIENLLLSNEQLEEKGINFVYTNRGGDITFHGPGQIVGYPVIDLEYFFTDIGKYLRGLEEVIIRTLAGYGITAGRSAGETGVWLEPDNPLTARKICAMGIRCSRWVTMHGFALNVNTDLGFFGNIIACGIADKKVASLHAELGCPVDEAEVKAAISLHFGEVFGAEMHWA